MTYHRLAQFTAISLLVDAWIIYAVRAIWRAITQ